MVIAEVHSDSNALRSRLQKGDILVLYDGVPVDDMDTFVAQMKATQGRSGSIPLVLIRGKKVLRLQVYPGPLGVRIEPVP